AVETAVPAGFKAGFAQGITVSEEADENVINVADDPVCLEPGEILVKKDAQAEVAQGNASLCGAEYSARFYGGLYDSAEEAEASGTLLRSWVLSTDTSGLIKLDEGHRVSGDALYTHTGTAVLPLGTLVIKEKTASEGYLPDPQAYLIRIKEGSEPGTAVLDGDGLDSEGRAVSGETVKRFGVRGVKLDAAKDAAEPSGDAALSGGRIAVINRSSGAVMVGGALIAPGETAAEMVTAAGGSFALSAELPYGSYELVETAAPAGYMLSGWSYTFAASPEDGDGKIFEVPSDQALKDEAFPQELIIRKWDAQRGKGVTGAVDPKEALEGIGFEVINRSARSVIWDGRTIEPGETVTTVRTAFDEGSGEYRAALSGLPYGTYGVRELAADSIMANNWYLADSTSEVQLQLHGTGTQNVTYHDVCDTRVCSLAVSKTVSGNMGNKDKEFAFQLMLEESGRVPVSFVKTKADGGQESGMAVFSGGKCDFSLSHGESIVFKNIVCGSSYSITEPAAEDEGYVLSWTGQPEGTLNTDTAVTANNDRNAVVSTGIPSAEGRGASAVMAGFAGTSMLIAAGTGERYGRKAKKKKDAG
ncbi:MAG: hypothetical protein IKX79_02105, partial [Desulfovibrionaceae bacterium]|nr:hypothetical protein [Desulfovibrionaceae bacterium]